MCSDTVISIRNVSKSFQIYERPHHRLMQSFYRGKKQYYREFTALKNISLNFKKGETVGIIGRNGAGKSTLLQLICGTMTPSSGDIEVDGRIAALLELGSGFNPEFTGRENVYMNATILGLNNDEIDKRFEDIARFADIGDFMEQPVKTYSSGMYVRLAFSVSINVIPEILIIDEALSVGDELFQRKCFARIKKLQEEGVAIIFVSHSAATVIDICDRAILLRDGECVIDSHPKDVVDVYHKQLFESSGGKYSEGNSWSGKKKQPARFHEKYFIENFNTESAAWYESNGAEISDPHIEDADGNRVNVLLSTGNYSYVYSVSFYHESNNVNFSMSLQTKNGIQIAGATSDAQMLETVKAGSTYTVRFNFSCLMIKGVHFFNAGVTSTDQSGMHYLHRGIDICALKVLNHKKDAVSGLCRILSTTDPIEIRELENV